MTPVGQEFSRVVICVGNMKRISEHLYCFADTCNVYAVVDGEAALLIDAGSGSVIEHLEEMGVRKIDWVLHTHHHRDQCWGDAKLVAAGAKIAVPEHERYLFDQAELHWQGRRTFDNYNDRNTFFTVGKNIPVEATLADYECFTWRDYTFYVLPAKGHTCGSAALLTEIDGCPVAFTGDLMMKGGLLYQLHAVECAYGDAIGILHTLQSIQALRDLVRGEEVAGYTWGRPALQTQPHFLPSHGQPIDTPVDDINRLERHLVNAAELGPGFEITQVRDGTPPKEYLPESRFIELSEHLLWGGQWTCSCFYVLLSQSGKALFIDYGHGYIANMHTEADHEGLDRMRFVEHHLKELRRDYGVTAIDLVIPTHVHDDHTCGIPHLQRFYGTQCFALEQVAQVLSDPAGWASTPCTFSKPIRIDRLLQDGETFSWEEYTFEIYHAPGQTEFASVISANIDGRKVAFTGDNLFLQEMHIAGHAEERPFQTTVFRNSFQLAMHRKCAEVMRQVSPDLICPGHTRVIPCDKSFLDNYCDFITRKERVFRDLVADPPDHYIDLFWVRMLPYIATVAPGKTLDYTLRLRNNFEREVLYEVRLLPPDGWVCSGEFSSTKLKPGASDEIVVPATAPPAGDNVRRLMCAEILIDGVSQGPIAEALVTVT